MGNPRSDIREARATSSPVQWLADETVLPRTIKAENVRLLQKMDSGSELQDGEHDLTMFTLSGVFFPPSNAAGELFCLNLISKSASDY